MEETLVAVSSAGFLGGGGEMGERIRSFDWATTPLGPADEWPASLRSTVSIMLASKTQMILFWGPEFVVLYNDAYRPVFGAKHPRMLGKPGAMAWSEIWDTGAGLHCLLDGVVKSGESFWASDLLFVVERHGYAEETYFDISYDPVRDDAGDIVGVLCIVTETTGRVLGGRRVRTMRDLATRSADLRTLSAAAAASMESLASNPQDVACAALLRIERDGLCEVVASTEGGEVLAALVGDCAEALQAGTTRIIPIGTSERTRLPRGAWDRAPESIAFVPLPVAAGAAREHALVIGMSPMQPAGEDYRGFLELLAGQIATSIGNAQAHESERQRAEALDRLDRAKTAFFSNVSHEFRTPLTLLLGPLDEMLSGSALGPENRVRAEVALRNALRLQKLVNTLLEFSRIEAGRVEASYEATDLAALTADLASNFRSAAERAGLRLTVDCQPLSQGVYVDREMWEKIVFNLLSNAFKFTLEGQISVRLLQRERHVELVVQDSGTGIPSDELPHIFERFHRVRDARGRSFEGTGIGLALVHELVQLHGGLIEVASEVNLGTSFTVSLPLGSAHLPADRLRAGVPRDGNPLRANVSELMGWLPAGEVGESPVADFAGRCRILLADDNADMREYIRRVLAGRYDVVAVSDGVQALRAAREWRPDLVLTDVMMPEMDGLGLLAALRADEFLRDVPVILVSARAGEEARVEGLAAGANDYLVKPFSARELEARVASRLELSRLHDQMRRDHDDLATLFTRTPIPTAVLRGHDLVCELENDAFRSVNGGRAALGRPLLEAIPELMGQGFEKSMREVLRTGVPHSERESLVRLVSDGVLADRYFTFVFAPLRGTAGESDRVIISGLEVTADVQRRKPGRLGRLFH